MPWKVIAQVVGVDVSTLHEWKNGKSLHYNQDFATMVDEAEAEVNTGKIKAGQVKQAQKHKLKKTISEVRPIDVRSTVNNDKKEYAPPPEMPPSWFLKPYLIDYADQVLDLTVHPSLSIPEIKAECLLRIKELTVYVRVETEIEQEVDPNQPAVKNVLTNMGKEEKRWNFNDKHEHDVTDKLGKLLMEIGSNRSVLPKQEEIEDFENGNA